MRYKAAAIEESGEQGLFSGYAAVYGNLDHDGDIIDAGAFDDWLEANQGREILLLAQHDDKAEPIGKIKSFRSDATGLFVSGYIADTAKGRDYRTLVREGIIDSMSIGYDELDSYIDNQGRNHLTKLRLVEISLVNLPANERATIHNYKSGGKTMADVNNNPEVSPEQIATAVVDLVVESLPEVLDAAIEAKMRKMADEDAEQKNADTNEEETKNEGSEDDAEGGTKNEGTEEDAGTKSRKRVSAKAREAVQRKFADIYMHTENAGANEQKLEKGHAYVRYVKSMHHSAGDPERAASYLKKSYGDATTARKIKAQTITNPREGGFLVPEVIANDLIPLLYPKMILTALGATVIDMPGGNLTIPKMESGTNSYYVGEMRKGKSSMATFGNIKLSSKKQLTMVPISKDLLRINSVGADALILKDVVAQMAATRDRAGLIGKGTEYEPAGIYNNKDIPTITLNSAPNEKTTGRIMAELIRNNAATDGLGWAINGDAWEAFYNVVNAMGLYIYRDAMDSGKIGRYEFGISTQIPSGSDTHGSTDIILGDFGEVLIGQQLQMETEVLDQATIPDAEGNLLHLAANDAVALKVLDIHDFGVRQPKAFVKATGLYTK